MTPCRTPRKKQRLGEPQWIACWHKGKNNDLWKFAHNKSQQSGVTLNKLQLRSPSYPFLFQVRPNSLQKSKTKRACHSLFLLRDDRSNKRDPHTKCLPIQWLYNLYHWIPSSSHLPPLRPSCRLLQLRLLKPGCVHLALPGLTIGEPQEVEDVLRKRRALSAAGFWTPASRLAPLWLKMVEVSKRTNKDMKAHDC